MFEWLSANWAKIVDIVNTFYKMLKDALTA